MTGYRLGPASLAPATAGRTDIGLVREVNEDSLAEFEHPSGRRLLVVADGMGGHRGGATASRLCVETLGEVFHRSSDDDPEALLRAGLTEANQRIHRSAAEDLELSGMGTTAVLLLLDADAAWVAHLGDSRAYLMRGGVLRPLTEDHTVVAAMQKRGLLSPEQAETHPRRHELVHCVGFHQEVDPEISRLEVLPGDRFLLCSDGLSGQVPEDEIAAVIASESTADAVVTLVAAANAAGGRDNVTVMLAAMPGGATTVVDVAPPRVAAAETAPLPVPDPSPAAELANRHRQTLRHQRRRRAAATVAIVAGLLTIGVLWLTVA